MSATDTGEFTKPSTQDRAATHEPAGATTTSTTNGRPLSVAGLVLGIVTLLLPILFAVPAGIAGMVFGYLGHQRGDKLGKTAMIVAGITTALAIALAAFAISILM